jgi:riboflavin synthase
MFTGIIKDIGIVSTIEKKDGIHKISIKSKLSKSFHVDESVCHNGICLTVISKNKTSHTVQVIPETLKKTNFGEIKKGSFINLEPSLTLNTLISGHLVQGHVDCITTINKIDKEAGAIDFYIKIPKVFKKYLIPHGSICINGVSLTIAEISKKEIKVSIIPYTFQHTNFYKLKEDQHVNIEFDMIGKYVLNK